MELHSYQETYLSIGHYEADGGLNEPIVMCTRDPGMVIDYPITGPWVKGITPPEEQNMFLFGFYMPIIEKKLKDGLSVSSNQAGYLLRKLVGEGKLKLIDTRKKAHYIIP